MDYVQGVNRDQMMMFSLDQLVEGSSFVRIIDAYVDQLDLAQLGFSNVKLNAEGRPPYKPSDLLKLYLFGYYHRLRSGRALERACICNIEVLWLLKQVRPSYRTINLFRKSNAVSLQKMFSSFVSTLKKMSLVEGGTIAIDSFKIRAQNAKGKHFNERKVKWHLSYIENKEKEYLDALEQSEEEEKQVLNEKLEKKQKQREFYQKIEKKVAASESGQIYLTDPDAKMTKFRGNNIDVGYNVQACSDAQHNLLVGLDI